MKVAIAVKRVTASLLILLAVSITVHPANAAAVFSLPATNTIPWGYDRCGVPGGIPHRTNIYATLGAGAATAQIQSTINSCPSNHVVFLGRGVFNITSTLNLGIGRNGITLRGSGTNTVLRYTGSGGGSVINLGVNSPLSSGAPIVAGSNKDSTNITVSSTAGLAPGQLIVVDQENDAALVWTTSRQSRMLSQMTRIEAINGEVLTVWPPLLWTFKTSLDARVKHFGAANFQVSMSGIEDLNIEYAGSASTGIFFDQAFGCWVKSVQSIRCPNYHFDSIDSLRCSYLDVWALDHPAHAPNHSGIRSYKRLCYSTIENCVFYRSTPPILLSHSASGNVIAYNFSLDSFQDGFGQYNMLWLNHGAHPMMNLCEGNFGNGVISDGYFGSSSHCTIFRNYLHGWTPSHPWANSCAVGLKRWTLYYNVVANVLGRPGVHFSEAASPGWAASYSKGAIWEMSYPNTGNDGFIGTRPPNPPINPGNDQSRDLNVVTTTFRHYNFDFYSNAIINHASSPTAMPTSLYLTSKPSWLGNLPWPLIGPDVRRWTARRTVPARTSPTRPANGITAGPVT